MHGPETLTKSKQINYFLYYLIISDIYMNSKFSQSTSDPSWKDRKKRSGVTSEHD